VADIAAAFTPSLPSWRFQKSANEPPPKRKPAASASFDMPSTRESIAASHGTSSGFAARA
jgi:hypothetical protein